MVDVKYIGHSAFQLTNGDSAVLIDPFVRGNPQYDWKKEPLKNILVTHGHGDHLGQAIEIAKIFNYTNEHQTLILNKNIFETNLLEENLTEENLNGKDIDFTPNELKIFRLC